MLPNTYFPAEKRWFRVDRRGAGMEEVDREAVSKKVKAQNALAAIFRLRQMPHDSGLHSLPGNVGRLHGRS